MKNGQFYKASVQLFLRVNCQHAIHVNEEYTSALVCTYCIKATAKKRTHPVYVVRQTVIFALRPTKTMAVES